MRREKKMTKKKILIAAFLIILCGAIPYMDISYASAQPTAGFNPSNISGISVGSTFTVSLQINGVTNLWGWTISLAWDPTILQMSTAPTEGPFLKTAGSTVFVPVPANNTLGIVESMSCLVLSNNGATGTGILANLTFSVIKTGNCQINITSSEFDNIDSSGNSAIIPVVVSNAVFSTSTTPLPTPSSPTHGPSASFSPVDGSNFPVGASILLDASSSLPGNDTQICPITNYAWSIETLNGTAIASLTGENATFVPSVEGTFRIILIVTAIDIHSPANPSYVTSDSATCVIDVVSNPQLVNIDLSTDEGGTGSGVSSGTYGPLQLMQMYASVTNKNAPVPDENVVFSIQNSNSSVILVRQGTTNQTGIASANFRLPTPDPSTPQNKFGTWSITASVNIMNTTINDTTNFTFNYPTGLENITLPASIQKTKTLPIQLTIDNVPIPNQWTELRITIFDQAGIPIGSTTLTTKQTQNITVIDTSIIIPSWAFTGQATVDFCLLTNSTNTSSFPIAPETTASFQILP